MSEGGSIEKSLLLQILSQLGELGQQLGNLQASSTHILQEQQSAAGGRAGIYARLGSVEKMAGEVDRIVPLVDKHEAAYNQATGVAWLWKGIWALLGGVLVAGIIYGLSHLGWKP